MESLSAVATILVSITRREAVLVEMVRLTALVKVRSPTATPLFAMVIPRRLKAATAAPPVTEASV
jgi:hypothetical protein